MVRKAGLIFKVSIANQGLLPFKAYTKENFFKLFLFDVGMLAYVSDLSPEAILKYDYGSYKGYFAENFVLQEYITATEKKLYAWQESSAEIQFLIEKQGQVVPVEVKAGNSTKAKSLAEFARKYNPPYRVKVTGKPFSISNDGKSKNIPLYLIGFGLL